MQINLRSLITKLNDHTRNALEGAAGLCLSRGQYNVEFEHWLMKLLENGDTDMVALLEKFNVNVGALQRDINKELDTFKTGNTRAPALSQSIVDVSKQAWLLASVDFGHHLAGSGHILTAVMSDDSLRRSALAISKEFSKLSGDALRDALPSIVGTTAESVPSASADSGVEDPHMAQGNGATPALDKYTINLTKAAKEGSIDKVLGRDQEVRQIIDILTRRRQNNPILTGEAGVGKTAVVEGFALRIAEGDVPPALQDVTIHSLDLGLLQAGASVKGEFENRLKSVIKEVKQSAKPIIMFIDEAHTLIGAGGKEGQGDAANLLKPALARGELRTIAATTWAEYKKYFERDPALTRRFQVVKVEEPSVEKAIDMMRAIAGMLQKHHKVKILDEAIVDSVRLSSRYIPSRQLPDKSVSLLDTACARVSLSQTATPAAIEDNRRALEQSAANLASLRRENAAHGGCDKQIDELLEKIASTENALEQQQSQWEQEKALVAEIRQIQEQLESDHNELISKDAEALQAGEPEQDESVSKALSDSERAKLKEQLQGKLAELDKTQGDSPLIQANVSSQAVAEVVANWTGIPVGKMVSDEINAILDLDKRLGERVIGQQHGLKAIAEAIKQSRAGLTDPRKPIGVFFMVGSSGVGKTETALALADLLYGGEHSITTINMSEFKEEHKVSMLLGSPPGYVGYGEGGVLTEAVRRKPYSVVLLDEMEKAHPGVQDVFYNLFDKGTIKDGEGRDIDFRNTVIIMTSNAAEEHIRAMCNAAVDAGEDYPGHEVILDNFRPHLLNHFKPAFLGRTTLIPYLPLREEELVKIAAINMRRIEKRVNEHYGAQFTYDEDVLLHIVGQCFDADTGARNIENIIARNILPEMATQCLEQLAAGNTVQSVTLGVSEDEERSNPFEISVITEQSEPNAEVAKVG